MCGCELSLQSADGAGLTDELVGLALDGEP
jgi:hypothetical protein